MGLALFGWLWLQGPRGGGGGGRGAQGRWGSTLAGIRFSQSMTTPQNEVGQAAGVADH